MSRKRAFLIHGWGGYAKEGWRPWLKGELEKRNFAVSVPQMPDTEHPKMGPWLSKLSETVGEPDGNSYFVGHSLGCITILRYLEGLREDQAVGGAVLVAGFTDTKITVGEDEDINELKTFFETNINFVRIRNSCKRFLAIHSDNDPYVSLRYADIFKQKLNAGIIIEHGSGHFSGDDGIKELPVALSGILDMVHV